MLLFTIAAVAQNKKEYKFNPVSIADFNVQSPLIDSNVNAVVLADVGSSEFVGNNNGDFTLVFKQHRRIFLRNRNAFEAATVKIPVYLGANFLTEEKFEDFDAATYTIENGQVLKTKLDKSGVFTEKLGRDRVFKKFTFPNLHEGCIIDYQYTIKSPFYTRLRQWVFQGQYPCLWSEYRVAIPSLFNYFTSQQGYVPYTIDTVWSVYKTYSIVEQTGVSSSNNIYRISGNATMALWAIADVPAFKTENFTTTPDNYINKIKFQLGSITYSENNVRQVMKNWFETSTDLMKDEDFGLALKDPNGWLSDVAKPTASDTNEYLKIKRIYEYVKNTFKCNDHDALWLSQPLKKTFQNRSGNVADINILLTALLINHGYQASPVILSTRGHGFANESSPWLSQYNYVISRVTADGQSYLLDASDEKLGFGRLPEECYNMSARVVDEKMPVLIPLKPDDLAESKSTVVFVINSENEKNQMEGSFTSNLGYFESHDVREKLSGGKPEDLLKDIKKALPSDITIQNFTADSLKLYDNPVSVKFEFKYGTGDEDILYVNPMMGEGYSKNPFFAATRSYPVEMPYPVKEIYMLNMEIPKGYKVDELPKSARLKFNEDEGSFDYIISASPSGITLHCKLELKKATFKPADYDVLRDFFAFVVKKQAEQIVLKKIK